MGTERARDMQTGGVKTGRDKKKWKKNSLYLVAH